MLPVLVIGLGVTTTGAEAVMLVTEPAPEPQGVPVEVICDIDPLSVHVAHPVAGCDPGHSKPMVVGTDVGGNT